MDILNIKNEDGTWTGIPIIQGQPGKDGLPGTDGKDGADGKDGLPGAQGIQGPEGPAGKDAVINGVNTLTITQGENITITQDGSNMTISSTASGGGGSVEIDNASIIKNEQGQLQTALNVSFREETAKGEKAYTLPKYGGTFDITYEQMLRFYNEGAISFCRDWYYERPVEIVKSTSGSVDTYTTTIHIKADFERTVNFTYDNSTKVWTKPNFSNGGLEIDIYYVNKDKVPNGTIDARLIPIDETLKYNNGNLSVGMFSFKKDPQNEKEVVVELRNNDSTKVNYTGLKVPGLFLGQDPDSRGQACILCGNWLQSIDSRQIVLGTYNKALADTSIIIGNGELGERKNSTTITQKGKAWFADDVVINGTNQDDAPISLKALYDAFNAVGIAEQGAY